MADLTRATRALEDWAAAQGQHDGLGWPALSSEARAIAAAAGATRVDGVARWCGNGAPPPMPRSTKQQPRPRIPRLSGSRTADRVERLLLDLAAEGSVAHAQVLRASALAPPEQWPRVAGWLRLSLPCFRRVRLCGLEWLAARLSDER